MSLSEKRQCHLFRQALDCARATPMKDRDLIRHCIDHAKTCEECKAYIKKEWGTVEELEKYLELKAWPEYDTVMPTSFANGEKQK